MELNQFVFSNVPTSDEVAVVPARPSAGRLRCTPRTTRTMTGTGPRSASLRRSARRAAPRVVSRLVSSRRVASRRVASRRVRALPPSDATTTHLAVITTSHHLSSRPRPPRLLLLLLRRAQVQAPPRADVPHGRERSPPRQARAARDQTCRPRRRSRPPRRLLLLRARPTRERRRRRHRVLHDAGDAPGVRPRPERARPRRPARVAASGGDDDARAPREDEPRRRARELLGSVGRGGDRRPLAARPGGARGKKRGKRGKRGNGKRNGRVGDVRPGADEGRPAMRDIRVASTAEAALGHRRRAVRLDRESIRPLRAAPRRAGLCADAMPRARAPRGAPRVRGRRRARELLPLRRRARRARRRRRARPREGAFSFTLVPTTPSAW